MRHLRQDHNRIQDPAEKIGEHEPVFLIRGKDAAAPNAIRAWAKVAQSMGADQEHMDAVRRFANYVEYWQEGNGCKVPDAPLHMLDPKLQISLGSCSTSGGSC